MAKKILQDMVTTRTPKRNANAEQFVKINKINKLVNQEAQPEKIIQKEKKEETKENRVNKTEEYFANFKKREEVNIIKSGSGSTRTRKTLWFVAVVCILFLFFAISNSFGKATVTLVPKTQDLVLNENLSANLDAGSTLPFNLVAISGEEDDTVEATTEKTVLQKAVGVVVIYNTSSVSQILSIDTRLEGSNGKIYKTATRTTVPAMIKGGKPGSIEVNIYASVAGDTYNSAPLDFKIAGFKGTPKYTSIYARSKGAITGGLNGTFPALLDADKITTINTMKQTLEAKLLKKAIDQTPSGFILFKDATFLTTQDPNIDLVSHVGNSLPVGIKGTLYGILFDVNKLTQRIVKNNIKGFDGSPVFLTQIENLKFSLLNKDSMSFDTMKSISFSLKGNTTVVWKVDETKFTSDLLGKSKKDFSQIVSKYPNIELANLSIVPPWKTSIPDSSSKIKVIVNYPK